MTGRRDIYIDRCVLVREAVSTVGRMDAAALVRLWVATMMWGSGTSNGRGPWRTAQGLSQPELVGVLHQTAQLVQDSHDVAAAHRAFRLDGCGESFFTKWLWVVSLADSNQDSRPLILDARVRSALALVNRSATTWHPPQGARGYAAYVASAHETAKTLQAEFNHIDAEKVEWVLFDRPPPGDTYHRNTAELCFANWLARGTQSDL